MLMSGSLSTVGVLAAVWVLVQPTALRAQVADRVPPGARVRIVADGIVPRPATATVAGWRTDSLLLDMDGRSRVPVPLASITRLEISRGRKSKLVTGAGVGLLVGAAATGVFLGMFCSDADTRCETDEVVRAFAIIAPPPTAIGAVIGLSIRVERWESVSLVERAAGGDPGRGLRIGVALGF